MKTRSVGRQVHAAVTALIAVLLAVSLFILANLIKTINSQKGEIESLSAEIGVLIEDLSNAKTELGQYVTETLDLSAQLRESREWAESLTEERAAYMAKFDVFTIFDYDTLINRHMPEEAVRLLENMVKSFSTSDEALYKSLFKPGTFEPDNNEYLMSFYDRYKGTEYTVRQISTYTTDIDFLQTGPYFAVVVAQAENGEYFNHPAVGIALDYETGKWVIYDFD